MNFADSVKKNTKKRKREKAIEVMNDWTKPFNINDLNDGIREICRELADEMDDPSVMLLGMLITLKLVDKFFPKEEFEVYMKEKEEGEKDGSK